MSPPLVSAKRDLAACDQCGKRRVGRARPGDAGLSCLANACRVGPPTQSESYTSCTSALGLRHSPWQWHEPAGPTDDRHDAHVASKVHIIHRNGPLRRPRALGRHDGATGEASCARARAVGIFYRGDKKVRSAEGQNNGLRGVPVIVGSRHGPCSGPGLARHAPRARTRRAWGSGCRVRGPRRIVRSMQGCRDRSRESRVTRCGILGSMGGGYRPCGRPAPSRHARMACAEALGLLQAYGSAPHNPTRRSTDPK